MNGIVQAFQSRFAGVVDHHFGILFSGQYILRFYGGSSSNDLSDILRQMMHSGSSSKLQYHNHQRLFLEYLLAMQVPVRGHENPISLPLNFAIGFPFASIFQLFPANQPVECSVRWCRSIAVLP